MNVPDIISLVALAHAGQRDKQGRDYTLHHLIPIAARLEPYGDDAVVVGLLHDVIEDTSWSATGLVDRGVPPHIVRAVESVTRRDGELYAHLILRAAGDPLGVLAKLADNEWNIRSNPSLAETDPDRAASLLRRYRSARDVLIVAAARHGHRWESHPEALAILVA